MVFVIDKQKNQLLPTTNAKARILLNANKAVIHKIYPFVIRLKTSKTINANNKCAIKLDPGANTTGVAIVDKEKCLFLMEIIHRGKEIRKALFQRKVVRRNRRQRNSSVKMRCTVFGYIPKRNYVHRNARHRRRKSRGKIF